jgi:hypothetical protein
MKMQDQFSAIANRLGRQIDAPLNPRSRVSVTRFVRAPGLHPKPCQQWSAPSLLRCGLGGGHDINRRHAAALQQRARRHQARQRIGDRVEQALAAGACGRSNGQPMGSGQLLINPP